MTRYSYPKWRSFAAGTAVVATLGLGGCGLAGSSDWRSEARCQPPGGGLSPEAVLPDPVACPEAYEGTGNGGSAPVVPGVEDPGSSEPWQPAPTPPCSRTESLNGFPCYDVDPNGNPGPYYP